MTDRIPTDGPDAALYRVVKKLRLRYSNAFVVQAIAAHPRPSSLLALVEVARRMGLETTPAETNVEHLAEISLPAVVHFNVPGAEGGFGVLEKIDDAGFHVWDAISGRRVVDRERFGAWWSGVVVVLQPGTEAGAREHKYARQRLLEIVAGGTATPSLDAGPAAAFLRLAGTALIVVLSAAGIAAAPSSDRGATAALLVLALAGALVTALMAAATGSHNDPLADRICRRGRFMNCQGVLASRYARVFGLALADVGLAFYAGMILLIATTARLDPDLWRLLPLAYMSALPFALLLVAVQVSMRQFCTLCLATHAVNLAGAVIGWSLLWEGPLRADDLYTALAFALYFGGALFVLIPYARRGRSLAFITERHRRIAGSPFGTLAQLITEPPVELRAAACALPLDGAVGEHELVILVHPSCGKCLPVLREVVALPGVAPLRVFVGVAPKDPTEEDRGASADLVATWMAAPDRIVDGYAAAKKHWARLTGAGDRALLAEELGIAAGEIEAGTGAARPLVEEAERVVNEHSDGTPALFFDSRPFTGPVAHLAVLLREYPDLVRLP